MRKVIRFIGFIALLFIAFPAWAMETESHKQDASKIHFHGYGELHYNDPATSTGVPTQPSKPVFDFHRMVWGMSYAFTDKISLHTEIDFEHAARELELEYSYIDFEIRPQVNVRAGAVLLPVGPLNEFHEPTLFYSVERAQIHTLILPTSWAEPGVGIFGESAGLKYRLYAVKGLDASFFEKGKGIREGRRFFKENATIAESLAGVGRLEYVGIPGLSLGTSVYSGGANNNKTVENDTDVTLWDADVRFRKWGFDIQTIAAESKISNVGSLAKPAAAPATGSVPLTGIGSKQRGTMFEVAYRMGDVVPFVRSESIDTQIDPVSGRDGANDRDILTYGFAYFPATDVAIKIDQEDWEDGTGETGKRTNVGIAYMY